MSYATKIIQIGFYDVTIKNYATYFAFFVRLLHILMQYRRSFSVALVLYSNVVARREYTGLFLVISSRDLFLDQDTAEATVVVG
jgi:hypothetical protein